MKMFFIFVIMFSQIVFADECLEFKGYTMSADLCWHEDLKAFVSKNCAMMKCDAVSDVKARYPATENKRRINSTSMACTRAGAETVVLRDKNENKASY